MRPRLSETTNELHDQMTETKATSLEGVLGHLNVLRQEHGLLDDPLTNSMLAGGGF